MMKLLLLALFSMFCFVQPFLTYVITSNGKILHYVNSPATFICTQSHAIWAIDAKNITECNCPGKCGDVLFDSTRITASCNGSNPVLHFKQMKLTDSEGYIRCVRMPFPILVGMKTGNFYPKKSFALVDDNYSLVCVRKEVQPVDLYDDNKRIGHVEYTDYVNNFDKENFNITAEHPKVTLLIKKVSLKDDGKIFGCNLFGMHLSLLNLTVNVPVSSVSLHQENRNYVLIEHYTGTFFCKVDESKPKASFEWILSENGSEREITENINITSIQNGKLWQTTSTLKLKLQKSFQTIKCRARIEGMAWTNSNSLSLNVKYPPPGKPIITVNDSEICVGEPIRIRCEWKGGNPNASVKLTCLSTTKIKEYSTTIEETVTSEMSNDCNCEGMHFIKNAITTSDLHIQYPPNQVVINQTSYLKGKPSSLICVTSGGSPDDYTYSWSPGNYPAIKEININLTQVADQEFICTVKQQKCVENFIQSTPTKIIVEYYPIIKTPNRITVIENVTKELKCISEGNPEPRNMWKIGNKINSASLQTSFTRQNATSVIQCIAIANSSEYGILKTVQNISIVVTYAPEITISYEMTKNEIQCSADANPSNITYELIQKWGSVVKKKVNGGKMIFKQLTYQDLGEWTCRASNGVPTNTGKNYSQMSVKVRDNIPAQFIGDETQQAIIGHQKSIKVCFYCHPEATAVEWRSENGKISQDKSGYSSAKDGEFPFTGNCSILTLDITEKSAKRYYIMVENELGNHKFAVNLDITEPEENILLINLYYAGIALSIILISTGLFIIQYRIKSTKKKLKAAMANRPLPTQPKLD